MTSSISKRIIGFLRNPLGFPPLVVSSLEEEQQEQELEASGGSNKTAAGSDSQWGRIWLDILKFIGPGFMVGVGYLDPGGFLTHLESLSLLSLSSLFLFLFSSLSLSFFHNSLMEFYLSLVRFSSLLHTLSLSLLLLMIVHQISSATKSLIIFSWILSHYLSISFTN
jgi:hypothetical protein